MNKMNREILVGGHWKKCLESAERRRKLKPTTKPQSAQAKGKEAVTIQLLKGDAITHRVPRMNSNSLSTDFDPIPRTKQPSALNIWADAFKYAK